MITDRELLKLAAKAACIEYLPENNYRVTGIGATGMPHLEKWNPLTDDSDALRLSVKLALCISHWPNQLPPHVMAGYGIGPDSGGNITEDYGSDKFSATRRVIVCAAAEIGGAIP